MALRIFCAGDVEVPGPEPLVDAANPPEPEPLVAGDEGADEAVLVAHAAEWPYIGRRQASQGFWASWRQQQLSSSLVCQMRLRLQCHSESVVQLGVEAPWHSLAPGLRPGRS